MPRDRIALVYDAFQAARYIQDFLEGKSFADYDADKLLQWRSSGSSRSSAKP